MIKLIHGDCLEKTTNLINDDVKIDVIVTDPPYEISNSGGGMMADPGRKFIRQIDSMGMCKSNFDVYHFLDSCIKLFFSKSHFCGIFFCSMLQIKDYLCWAEGNKLKTGIGVWHKTNPPPLCNNKYLNDLEYWIYIKGPKSRIKGTYKTKSLFYQSPVNKKDKKLYQHPTVKPLPLIEKFIINHSDESGTVLDPFMGSGTTGVACKNLNRNFIGIELDEKYFKIAKERIGI